MRRKAQPLRSLFFQQGMLAQDKWAPLYFCLCPPFTVKEGFQRTFLQTSHITDTTDKRTNPEAWFLSQAFPLFFSPSLYGVLLAPI